MLENASTFGTQTTNYAYLLRHPSNAGLTVASAVNREESWPTGTRKSSAIMRSVNRNFQVFSCYVQGPEYSLKIVLLSEQWLSRISGEFQVNFRHIERSYSQAMFMACSCFVQEAFSRFHAMFMRCSGDVRLPFMLCSCVVHGLFKYQSGQFHYCSGIS